ncbi:MAG TPA: protein kinase [Candidatus Limnocylindrales bacterium]|nr:protein kinase [Candidatus Limnocylindrales bacterium]
MRPTPGSRLGSYEIVEALGAGGMGEVYRARDPRLGRDVAIKALPPAFAADPVRLSRFRREAQTLASLNHPNIAAIYGLEEADGSPHLVLELVEGETLAARLARGSLPQSEALSLCIQIAGAIEAAHERGIVHRDLKPGNVMINQSGMAKVLDFGLAKSDPEPIGGALPSDSPTLSKNPNATAAGVIFGTAAYMSPEQARGKPVDRRSDVWSFGCVLLECFTGRPAFAGETTSDLIARILEREPDWSALPPGVPPRIREILRRCLRKNADERPRDIRDVRLELSDVALGGRKAAAGREKSVAVMPFENLSGADDEYFADGVTDEILNALSQIDSLRVAARASCFAFKGRREDLREIGEKLDVTTVLEGTVRRAGSRLRITVQLANAADGYQLWSERYDREMTDVFAVQDEIASAIATRLRGAMHAEADQSRARGSTKNLEAYELLLKGRALQMKRGRFMAQAVACFEKAIAIDPRYAEPLASLSDSYRLMGTFGVAPFAEVMSKAKALGERALAIDPKLAEAWATLAAVEEQFDRNYARSDSLYERALEFEPRNATTRAQRALWRVMRGAMPDEEALMELRRAVSDDPLNAWVGSMYSYLLGIVGRHEESIAEAERSMALDAESFFAHWNMMRGHAWAGHLDRAIAEAPALLVDSGRHPWALGLLAWTYGRAGRSDLARACYDELEGRSRHEFVSPSWVSVAAGAAGLEEATIRWIERAVAERDPLVLWTRRLPFWEYHRAHPKFRAVMREVWG